MSRFQSTRQALSAVDVSRSSNSSLDPTLSTLSPEDASVLDAIIAKAPEATTFMTIFKAYTEVLQQRGLDPGNDIVYYKQLLKLGVIKGLDWGTKWSIVKDQLGLDTGNATSQHPSRRALHSQLSRLPNRQFEEDGYTPHSHADETETAVDPPFHPAYPLRRLYKPEQPSITETAESLELNSTEHPRNLSPPQSFIPIRPLALLRSRLNPSLLTTGDNPDDAPIRSSTPPLPQFRRTLTPSSTQRPRDTAGSSRKAKPNRINDVQAWKKIEQDRQVQDADRYRKETLLSMCFDTWKVGLDWSRTTHIQIVNARNYIQAQIFFTRWKNRTSRCQQVAERAVQVAQFRTRNAAFNFWREQAHRKRMIGWREEMRSLLIHFKQKREERIRNDAWTKWRQLYLSRQLYIRNLLLHSFRCWKKNFRKLVTLDSLAAGFEDIRERRTLEDAMDTWSRRVQMQDAEKYLVDKVARGTLTLAFDVWIRNFQDNHRADVQHAVRLLRRVLQTWQKTKAHKHILNSRGDKYLRRRNDLLLRAIARVWVARERGQLLERVKNARLSKDAFLVWQQRLKEKNRLDERAVSHFNRASGSLLFSTLKTWIHHHNIRQSRLVLAQQHDTANLLYQTLLVWRLRLRMRLRQLRKAKMARRYFLERQAWVRWRLVLKENRRLRKLQSLDRARLKRVFLTWLEVARRKIHQNRLVKACQKRTRRRVLRNVLQQWTNRVVFIKLREIDTMEQHDGRILGFAITKWKDMCLQQVENLSLVNSFQDVKREDTLRRMFIKWLAVARKSRSRRIRLAEREHELQTETLTTAWEIWRNRFRENGLRDLEYQTILQSQTNLLYRAFVIWQTRSKTVPGIRFHATNLKVKVWDVWRAAIPLAVQVRKAKELDGKSVLSRAFDRWKEAHRAKIALKAVARARYLRLPSPGHRVSASAPQDAHLRPLLHRPLRSSIPAFAGNELLPSTDNTSVPTEPTPARKKRLSSLLASRPASRAVTIDRFSSRSAEPPSSVDDDRRDRLWNELRSARLYESPRISRAKSR